MIKKERKECRGRDKWRRKTDRPDGWLARLIMDSFFFASVDGILKPLRWMHGGQGSF